MASMSLQAAYDQARQSLEANDLERAIGLAQHILEKYPDNLEAYRILGEAYLANRQLDRAQESFERVLRSDPENIPAHVGLGITSERQGQLERAIAEFELALEIKPDMTEIRSQLLRLYSEGWGSENAQLRLSRAGLARLYAKGHMLPQAITEFRQVIADQPQRFDARVALAETLWRDGQEDEAIDACRQILAERPESLKANLLMGYLLKTAGRPEGERYWQSAQQMDPYQGVAQVLFDPLPEGDAADPQIEEWDEAAWRRRRAAEQTETLAATRPMEAVTPVGTSAEPSAGFTSSWLDQPPAPPAPPAGPATPDMDMDDFLASLLASGPSAAAAQTPEAPAEPAPADDDLDMAPFSLADLGLSDDEIAGIQNLDEPAAPAPAPAPSAGDTQQFSLAELGLADEELAGLDSLSAQAEPAPAPATEPDMTPFSLADLGLSDDEIAALEGTQTPAAPAEPAPATEPDMTPFSLADLGLSDDEITALESAGGPAAAAKPAPEPATEPDMTPFSLADLGLSEEEISAFEGVQTPAAAPEPAPEPDMTPFSLADLGLSDDEIAALESAGGPAAPEATQPDLTPFSLDDLGLSDQDITGMENQGASEPSEGDQPNLTPFSLSELGLSDDEIAGLDSLQSPAAPAAREPDSADLGGLPEDLQPFSMDELDFGEESGGTPGGLPAALQPFSLDEAPPAQRTPPTQPSEPLDLGEQLDDDEQPSEPRGFSWQQASQKPEPGFLKPQPSDPLASDQSIFTKLKQKYDSADIPPPPPLPEVSIEPDEHLGLFSLDDVSLRDDVEHPTAEPVAPAEPAAPEIENLEDALASGQVAPFSLADLGLSPEEIAALGDTATPGTAEPAPAAEPVAPAEPAAPEIENLEDALASGQVAPFSLADLGLSPEEIAALESTTPAAPEPAPEIENLQDALASGQVAPFSLADLGLSPEEIAALEGTAAPAEIEPEPAAPAPEIENLEDALASGQVAPFSLADLGLSPEEIAALEGAPTASEPAEAEPAGEIENLEDALASGQVEPFSLADLGLSDDEIAALEASDAGVLPSAVPSEPAAPLADFDLEPFQEASDTPESAQAPDAGEDEALMASELEPFSLADLGLSEEEIGALGLGASEPSLSDELGLTLTEEELEGLDGGDLHWSNGPAAEPAAPAPAEQSPSDEQVISGDLVIDRLIALGRQQGFIDISDIIANVEDPEAEADRIEEIGQRLHEARVEIRDGDEVIDMDAEYAEAEQDEALPASATPARAAAPVDLDLAPDDEEPQAPAAPAEDEPDMTPFSLADLGLSEEEINALGLGEAEPAAPAQLAEASEPAAPSEPAEPNLTPFSLSELGLSEDEIASLGLGVGATDDQPEQATEPAPEAPVVEPAEQVAEPEPALEAPVVEPVAEPAEQVAEPEPVPEAPAAAPVAEASAAPAQAQPAAEQPALTGNDVIDAFLRQLDAEPENDVLRLAVARVVGQIGLHELAVKQYRHLIKQSRQLERVTSEIEDLIAYNSDQKLLQALHRALGDAYSKQGRLREAVDAYSWTLGGAQGSR